MAGFSAHSLEALDYDFTEIKGEGGKFCKGQGTIPEPTERELEAFIERVRNIGGVDATVPNSEVAEVLDAVPEDESKKVEDELVDAMVAFCKGKPTKAQLKALPIRYQSGFLKWLLDELTDPTKSNGATRR